METARCQDCGRRFDREVVHQDHGTRMYCEDCKRRRVNAYRARYREAVKLKNHCTCV